MNVLLRRSAPHEQRRASRQSDRYQQKGYGCGCISLKIGHMFALLVG